MPTVIVKIHHPAKNVDVASPSGNVLNFSPDQVLRWPSSFADRVRSARVPLALEVAEDPDRLPLVEVYEVSTTYAEAQALLVISKEAQ